MKLPGIYSWKHKKDKVSYHFSSIWYYMSRSIICKFGLLQYCSQTLNAYKRFLSLSEQINSYIYNVLQKNNLAFKGDLIQQT
jgi:hypothetical protein